MSFEEDLDPDPSVQFERWFADAQARGVPQAEAMVLATADSQGRPSARQVRVEGTVAKATRAESERYFQTRPLGSQLAAAVSRQSRPIGSRAELEAAYATLAAAAGEGPLPLPEQWGGYRLHPDAFEFWEHRDNRLHDRLRYERSGRAWSRVRLQP